MLLFISVIITGVANDMSRDMTTQQNECAPSEDSDQPGHPPSLISLRCPHEKSLGPLLPTEVDLSLRWAHSLFIVFFCRVAAHIRLTQ